VSEQSRTNLTNYQLSLLIVRTVSSELPHTTSLKDHTVCCRLLLPLLLLQFALDPSTPTATNDQDALQPSVVLTEVCVSLNVCLLAMATNLQYAEICDYLYASVYSRRRAQQDEVALGVVWYLQLSFINWEM
jgi:hypothetical protein